MQDVQRKNVSSSRSKSRCRTTNLNVSPVGLSQKSHFGWRTGSISNVRYDIRHLLPIRLWNILYVESNQETVHGISGTGVDTEVASEYTVVMSTKKKAVHPAIADVLSILGAKGSRDSASKGRENISYQTFSQEAPSKDGTFCALPKGVKKSKKVQVSPPTISPISNVPPAPSADETDVFDPRTLLAYRLQNRLQHTEHQLREALHKLSRALEVIVSEEQFFSDGMHRDQWETYG